VTREWRRAIATARAHCEVSELLRHSELPALLLDLSRGLESVHKVRKTMQSRFCMSPAGAACQGYLPVTPARLTLTGMCYVLMMLGQV
jgi:hypothetical protein